MQKRILSILLLLVVVFGTTACSSNIINLNGIVKTPDTKIVDFEVIDNNFYGTILVDKNTNVMYYWIASDSGGITPIYNSDGSLKLYEPNM